jgi:hypothetical protein
VSSTETPLRQSIGFAGVLRWVIVVAAVIAIGAAAAAGRFLVAGVLAAFVAGAGMLAFRVRRGAS